jgi:hypothetical protein
VTQELKVLLLVCCLLSLHLELLMLELKLLPLELVLLSLYQDAASVSPASPGPGSASQV